MTHRVRIRRALAREASRMRFAHGVDLKRPSPVPLLENRGMERLPREPVSPHLVFWLEVDQATKEIKNLSVMLSQGNASCRCEHLIDIIRRDELFVK